VAAADAQLTAKNEITLSMYCAAPFAGRLLQRANLTVARGAFAEVVVPGIVD